MKDLLQPDPRKSPEEYFEMGLNMAREIVGIELTPDQAARLLIESGKVCDSAGKWALALEKYEEATKLCESDETKADALKYTGHIKSKLADWEAASEAYEASLEILKKLGKASEIGLIYNSIGFNCFEIGEIEEAREYYNKALEIAKQCGNIQLMADINSNLGVLSSVHLQREDAVKYYKKSISGYESVGDGHGLAQVHHNLAMTYTDMEEWKIAGEHYQKSMELCIRLGEKDLLAILYTNRAQYTLRLYDAFAAKLYCDKALEIFKETDNMMGVAEIHKLYGMLYSSVREWDSAEKSFWEGIEVCEKYDNHLTAAEIYYELGLMNNERQQKEDALKYMRKAAEIFETLEIEQEVLRIKEEIQEMAE